MSNSVEQSSVSNTSGRQMYVMCESKTENSKSVLDYETLENIRARLKDVEQAWIRGNHNDNYLLMKLDSIDEQIVTVIENFNNNVVGYVRNELLDQYLLDLDTTVNSTTKLRSMLMVDKNVNIY